MSVSGWAFVTFVVFSGVLVVWFYKGVRINVKRAKEVASILEDVLQPEDKIYTWLGGVIGFSAEYKVKGFEKVVANFRMIPRHSLLWLPFVWIVGRKDNLQLLFYLKRKVPGECHLLRESFLKKTKIYNNDNLRTEKVSLEGISFEAFYDKRNSLMF